MGGKAKAATVVRPAKNTVALGDDERRKVMCYVGELLVRMNLTEWTVLLSDTPTKGDGDEPPPVAEIHMPSERYCATLQLTLRWPTLSDSAKRETLVHEMIHLMTRDMNDRAFMWMTVLDRMSSPSNLSIGHGMSDYSTAEERFVDRMANLLAPFLPQYPGTLTDVVPNVRREQDWC